MQPGEWTVRTSGRNAGCGSFRLEAIGAGAALSGVVADLMPEWELDSRALKGSSRWTELCRVPTAARTACPTSTF